MKKCEHCGAETPELFDVNGYMYCSDCQLEAEAAEMDQVDYEDW